MIAIGTLTKTKTLHRVGPASRDVLAADTPTHLMLPLATVDGSVWGLRGQIPFVYCEYTDSKQKGLRFRREKGGVLRLLDESRKRLLEWERELTDMKIAVNVSPKPTFKAKYLRIEEITEPKPDLEQLQWKSALLASPKPVWRQSDQTPKSGGRAMRFLGQVRPTKFTLNAADFDTFVFINAASDELGIVWQNG